MIRKTAGLLATIVLIGTLIALLPSALARSPQRMSDKDMERMMTNMRNDAKRFADVFNPAIGKSTIRKTQQEKDGKALVKTFQNQTGALLEQFKRTKQAEPALTGVRDSASRIEKLLNDVPMGQQVNDAWGKVRTELTTITDAFK